MEFDLGLPFENPTHVIPPKLSYLTLYAPLLSKDDTDSGQMQQILCYVTTPPRDVSFHTQLRQIGLLQGMSSFARDFSEDDLHVIDTEKTRLVMHCVEEKFWIAACIELTRLVDADNESDSDSENLRARNLAGLNTEYSTAHLAPASVLVSDLKNAYRYFKLHHGSFSLLIARHSPEMLRDIFTTWWSNFSENWSVSLSETGFLKTLDAFKLSSRAISYSTSLNIKNVNLITEKLSEFFQLNSSKLVDMVVYNPLEKNPSTESARRIAEEHGVIFHGFSILSQESLVALYHWLEQSDFKGLHSFNLMEDTYPTELPETSPPSENGNTEENVVFDPFSTTINSITSFFSLLNPILGSGEPEAVPEQSVNAMLKQYTLESDKPKGRYLIGLNELLRKHSGSTPITLPNPDYILHSPWSTKDIFIKNVYVDLSKDSDECDASEESGESLECSLIVYEICGLVFVLVFESDYEDLQSMMFYEQLEENIVDLFDSINKYFRNETPRYKDAEPSKRKESSQNTDYLDYLSLKTLLLPFGMFFTDSRSQSSVKQDTNDVLRGQIENDQIKLDLYKQSFYYLVHVPELRFYQTSLPVIPHIASQANMSDSGFLDPRYMFDLLVSRTQALHLHNQLCLQFSFLGNNLEKMVSTDKLWWIYYAKALEKAATSTYYQDSRNYYENNNLERNVFILKKFGGVRKTKNLLFTDKSPDFLGMLGDNVKLWFENCISTGRV